VCGGNVKLSFQTLRPRQRWWEDLELEVRLGYGRGLSYRQIKAELDERLGHSVGLRTLNQQVLDPAGQPKPGLAFAVGEAPPVVRLDGIWITVMFPTGQVRKDRLGRLRSVKQARKVPILAAQGVWPVSGRTRLLAWTLAEGEDSISWEQFLDQLDALGISPMNGLALLVGGGSPGLWVAYQNRYWRVPMQRCVFHKLQNIAGAFHPPAGVDRKTARQQRRQFLRNAAQIWQAEDPSEAQDRYQRFCQQWRTVQAQAVATLTRDFEETLTFYTVQQQAAERGEAWPSHLLRTTSQLERSFRTFRHRYRSAVLFHSTQGAEAVTASIADRFS
jgi:transposase-like protein